MYDSKQTAQTGKQSPVENKQEHSWQVSSKNQKLTDVIPRIPKKTTRTR